MNRDAKATSYVLGSWSSARSWSVVPGAGTRDQGPLGGPGMKNQGPGTLMAASSACLVLEGVSRHFGGLKAVANVNLTLQPGARHALIGPNGAGKTTLFN